MAIESWCYESSALTVKILPRGWSLSVANCNICLCLSSACGRLEYSWYRPVLLYRLSPLCSSAGSCLSLDVEMLASVCLDAYPRQPSSRPASLGGPSSTSDMIHAHMVTLSRRHLSTPNTAPGVSYAALCLLQVHSAADCFISARRLQPYHRSLTSLSQPRRRISEHQKGVKRAVKASAGEAACVSYCSCCSLSHVLVISLRTIEYFILIRKRA